MKTARSILFLILATGAITAVFLAVAEGQAPIPPAPSTNDAITKAGTAAAANREAYVNACRALADDFGVRLPITITPAGVPPIVPPVPPKAAPKPVEKVQPIGKLEAEKRETELAKKLIPAN